MSNGDNIVDFAGGKPGFPITDEHARALLPEVRGLRAEVAAWRQTFRMFAMILAGAILGIVGNLALNVVSLIVCR